MAHEVKELIELSELKIGNYLLYKGEIVHVTSLSMDIDDEYEDTIGFCKLGETSNEVAAWNRSLYNDLERIPLTIDLLDRFGFRKFADDSYHQPAMLTWRVLYDDYEKAASYCTCIYPELGHRVYLNIRIEYVHQLQNIYYTMTGEELKLKDQ